MVNPMQIRMAALILSTAAAAAQLEVPRLGYAVTSAPAVRPIVGLVGAVSLGQAIPLGMDNPRRVEVAPGNRYALVESAENGSLHILQFDAKETRLEPIALAAASPDEIAFNSTGSAAALFYSSTRRLQVITGLPGSPALAWESDAGLLGESSITALALSDDAEVALAGARTTEESGSVWLLTRDTVRSVLPAGAISAIRFRPNSQDAWLGDRVLHHVLLLTDAAGKAESRILAAAAEQVSAPSGIEAGAGSALYVTQTDGPAVLIIQVDSGAVIPVTSAIRPKSILRANEKVLLVTDAETGAVALFDPEALSITPVIAGWRD